MLYEPNDYYKLYKCIKYAIGNFNKCKKKIKFAKKDLIKKANLNNNNYINFFDRIK